LAMAMPDCIHNLEEHVLGLAVITEVMTFFGDLGKQITLRAVFKNNISAIRAV